MEMAEDEVRKPKNAGEVLWWLMFEPLLLKEYSDTVKSWRDRLNAILMPLTRIAVLSGLIYTLLILLISGLDLPRYFPNIFKPNLVASWSINFTENLTLLFHASIEWFLGGLVGGLVLGLAGGLGLGLAGGLVFSMLGWDSVLQVV